jgi:tRNA threonylcarbamoyladenosine biosynthesis protein TsaE
LIHPADHSERLLRLHLADQAATERLGARLGTLLAPGMRVYLSGDLGTGKTTVVRAALRALGHHGRVKSPTYALVEPYIISSIYLYHFDFYRFRDPREWSEAGLRELFGRDAICLVEWPEKAAPLLPEPDLEIRLTLAGGGREALIEARTETGAKCVSALISQDSSS